MCESKEVIVNGMRSSDMKIMVEADAAFEMEYVHQKLYYYNEKGILVEETLNGIYYLADGKAIDTDIPYMVFFDNDNTLYKAFKVDSSNGNDLKLFDMTKRVIICNHSVSDLMSNLTK